MLFESGPGNSRVKYFIATVAAAAFAIAFIAEAFAQDAKPAVTARADVSEGELKKSTKTPGS